MSSYCERHTNKLHSRIIAFVLDGDMVRASNDIARFFETNPTIIVPVFRGHESASFAQHVVLVPTDYECDSFFFESNSFRLILEAHKEEDVAVLISYPLNPADCTSILSHFDLAVVYAGKKAKISELSSLGDYLSGIPSFAGFRWLDK